MKTKIVYACQECGHQSPRWLGHCPDCGKWNTFVEEVLDNAPRSLPKGFELPEGRYPATSIADVPVTALERLQTGIGELDRLLGGGLVPGGLVLLGGEPGIGKSTLLLQIGNALARSKNGRDRRILYVSGEESATQTKLRAMRLEVAERNLMILSETNAVVIGEAIRSGNPDCVVIDSIQSLYHPEVPSAPGSVSQVREATALFLTLCKRLNIPMFLIGHVTKDGTLAGPRVLEHMVDTVLTFEGERTLNYRLLRAVKNRFGSTHEVALFDMTEKGLQEVTDPSGALLGERTPGTSGSVVVPALEGSRPFLMEFQALVSPANFPVAQRVAGGVDYNRFCILLAVLEKKVGLHVQMSDVFVNVAGGFKITEPAADLGIALAIVSSFRDIPLPEDTIVFGEIGLTGELRAAAQAEKRITEAARRGFKRCVCAAHQIKTLPKKPALSVIGAGTLEEAIQLLLKR